MPVQFKPAASLPPIDWEKTVCKKVPENRQPAKSEIPQIDWEKTVCKKVPDQDQFDASKIDWEKTVCKKFPEGTIRPGDIDLDTSAFEPAPKGRERL